MDVKMLGKKAVRVGTGRKVGEARLWWWRRSSIREGILSQGSSRRGGGAWCGS